MMQSYTALVVSSRKYRKIGAKPRKVNYELADRESHTNWITRAEAFTFWGMKV
jgi:hypothetical protein